MKLAEKPSLQLKTFVPYTEMVEVEVLTVHQRDELLASLAQADKEEGVAYSSSLLKEAFMRGFKGEVKSA